MEMHEQQKWEDLIFLVQQSRQAVWVFRVFPWLPVWGSSFNCRIFSALFPNIIKCSSQDSESSAVQPNDAFWRFDTLILWVFCTVLASQRCRTCCGSHLRCTSQVNIQKGRFFYNTASCSSHSNHMGAVRTAGMIRFRRGCHALLKPNTWNTIHSIHPQSIETSKCDAIGSPSAERQARTGSVKSQTRSAHNTKRSRQN